MPLDTTPLDYTAELNAVMDEIAELEVRRDAIPPRIFCLRQRMKALKAYARTLEPRDQEAR